MEPFMVYAVSSSLFFALFLFAAKYIISNKMDNYISFIYLQGIMIVILFPIISYLITPNQIFLPPVEVIPYAIISGGTSIVGYLLMYYGLNKYDASSAVPIIGVKPIFIIPLSIVLLGEWYGLDVVFWILLTMFGAIITTWDERVKVRQMFSAKNRALWIFLVVAFFHTTGNIVVKPAMKIVSNFNFLVWREFAWFGVLLVLIPMIFHENEWASLRRDWRGALWPSLIAILLQYFGYLSMFYALGFSVQVSEGLFATQGFFAVTIGFMLSRLSSGLVRESHTGRIYLIRLIGALLIMVAIYGLFSTNRFA
jgi:drug/metabolite transporter (DMT)-like permease